ncbi:transmembrane protein 69-like [Takifugu flavidus]|uniref:Transmembrane protein 69 n=1 Tax=Takifugu flavidus TaxID=433684 RepID=A0A5C6P1L1_9TELE|nr:transmembrane protein 69-like [Takifugu flavidus]XP_056911915.1 transmembrane protein 69-like [Takifugu flavidus]XP_056911916.1 transmembrane protein 69-like [Takifugu flavidus]TWW72789.1 Transmembrane protein 69 [Takifugu flavidus]
MLRLVSTKRIISGVPGWRCLEKVSGTQASTIRAQLKVHSLAPSNRTSTGSLLNPRSVSWLASRLHHGDSQGSADGANNKDGFSLKSISHAPKPALYLGFSGLIPFLAAPLLMAATQTFHPEVAFAQMVYGASIVSFLGGARWGFALPPGSPAGPDWMNLGNSVVPSLLAWLALLCRDNITEGALVVMMGLGLSLHYDLALLPGYPPWFKAMRTILTLVATFSLVATLAIKQFCSEKKVKAIQNSTK